MATTNHSPVTVRSMAAGEVPTLLTLIDALLDYEGLPRPDAGARARLAADAAASPPLFWVLLAEREGRSVGYAFYFFTYSTILAQPTLFLEDLFVLPEARRGGVARALFRALARVAVAEGCGRIDWQVLSWNRLAMNFYARLGARPLPEWQPWRLLPEQFGPLAEEEG